MGLAEFDSLVKKTFIILSIIVVFYNIYKERSIITKTDKFVNVVFMPIYLILLLAEVFTIYNIWYFNKKEAKMASKREKTLEERDREELFNTIGFSEKEIEEAAEIEAALIMTMNELGIDRIKVNDGYIELENKEVLNIEKMKEDGVYQKYTKPVMQESKFETIRHEEE